LQLAEWPGSFNESCRVAHVLRPNLSLNPDASPAALTRRPLGAG
jgi:hypothetical protein